MLVDIDSVRVCTRYRHGVDSVPQPKEEYMNFTLTQHVKVLEKYGALQHIGELMKDAGFHKAFLVCDEGIVKLGIADRIQHILEKEGLGCVLYAEVQPDPPSEIIDDGAKICRAERCDCVIAVGGGSSIDTAKGINILRFNEGKILDYADMSRSMIPSPGLIAVPTTSGTGSELSNGLIISDIKNAVKVPILAVAGMSEFAVLDASLTEGMPASLTMVTGLDVFSHACEAYMSVLSCVATDLVCEKIMEEVIECLPRAVKNGSDGEARRRMLSCASLGGWMLACASAHVGHSVAHVIGARYHIPHGKACAYSLPSTIRFVAEACPEKVRRVGRLLGVSFCGDESAEEAGLMTANAYRSFCEGIGLTPLSLKRPDEEELQKLADAVVHEPLASLSPVPVTMDNVMPLLRDMFCM